MRIIGPDSVVFGVSNLDDCRQYLLDYGLSAVGNTENGGVYEALDGTSVEIYPESDPRLPAALETGSTLRQIIWGCEDQQAVEEIAAELSSDRDIIRNEDGSVWCKDDVGFEIAFRVTKRRDINLPAEIINSPGAESNRGVNNLGADVNKDPKPRTLSHIVLFVPDAVKIEKFYEERLGFITTDRFVKVGPFMRAASNSDHHSIFFLDTPPKMQGIEHLAFHMQGPNDVMLAGAKFVEKGYKSSWGPGRHIMGSNWFWYFKSPFGCHFEYDADMDLHDEKWEPRALESGADNSQTFLMVNVEKWAPGGDPH